jgi:SAM-dependent methyltransferase
MFNQFGQLRLSKKYDTEWQNAVLGLYNRVNAVLQRKFGYDLFAIYGTLLGLVRDGGFIGHDVDFDVAYISQHSDPQLVADELREIAFVLIDAGFDVLCRTTALHIHDEQDPETRIDVFHLFFDADGKLIFPFGKATHIDITKDEWAGLRDVPLGGQSVKLPVLGEAMAECLYGTSWRIPIPGFSWPRVRTGWGAGDLPESYCEEVHWSNFYAHHEMTEPSRFFEFVSAREDMPRTVLDIGCGDGRDSLAFARVSRPVLGIDRSEVGIRHATRRAGEAGLAGVANFAVGDVADEATVRSAVEQAREAGDGSGLLLYLRFVLNVLTEDTQEVLLRTLAATAQPGDVLAAEFRTENDRGTKKVHGRHYRRYQDGPAFAAALQERYGFDVFFEEEGSGFSPYQHEDPVLYRVLARFRETPDLS